MNRWNWREGVQHLYYCVCFALAAVIFGVFFPVRGSGLHAIRRHGPLLVIANHQSYLDPLILGMGISRPLTLLARATLFRFRPFAWLIGSLGATPIDLQRGGREGLKTSLAELKKGKVVVIFAEGTRTPDGQLGPLKPGVLLLARKTTAPMVVAGISGAFESWPRHQPLPSLMPIWVHFRPFELPKTEDPELDLANLQGELAVTFKESVRRRAAFMGRSVQQGEGICPSAR